MRMHDEQMRKRYGLTKMGWFLVQHPVLCTIISWSMAPLHWLMGAWDEGIKEGHRNWQYERAYLVSVSKEIRAATAGEGK